MYTDVHTGQVFSCMALRHPLAIGIYIINHRMNMMAPQQAGYTAWHNCFVVFIITLSALAIGMSSVTGSTRWQLSSYTARKRNDEHLVPWYKSHIPCLPWTRIRLHVATCTCSCIPWNNILNITIFIPDQADNGYPGQVKLKVGNPIEYRRVQLYYDMDESTQKWRDVCVKRDSADKIADSVCRQLGFTNANNKPLLDR